MILTSLKFPAAAAALLLAGGVTPALALPDASMPVATAGSPDAAMSARLAYNVGFELFEKARAEEQAAGALKGAKLKAASARVSEGFAQARTKFEEAAAADPAMKEAWNLIGYTNRRLGAYEASLAAYEKALALNPQYSEAIEYRAEAYLALNRLDDAKAAYMTLFGESRPHAAVLMQSMQVWVVERRKQAAGVAAADIDGFAKWVDERAAVAQQTASLSSDRTAVAAWN